MIPDAINYLYPVQINSALKQKIKQVKDSSMGGASTMDSVRNYMSVYRFLQYEEIFYIEFLFCNLEINYNLLNICLFENAS